MYAFFMAVMECQVAAYPKHKADCKAFAKPRHSAQDEDEPSTLTDVWAQELVQRATAELHDQFSTNSPLMPPNAPSLLCAEEEAQMAWSGDNDSAFASIIRHATQGGPTAARVLGKAGACALFVDALGRTLAGTCRIPILFLCSGIMGLSPGGPKNQFAFDRAGGIEQLTRVLASATEQRAWTVARHICTNLSYAIMDWDGPLNARQCDDLSRSGTFQAVQRCILGGIQATEAGTSCPSGAGLRASCRACSLLAELFWRADKCRNELCSHHGAMGIDPSLYAALDACLQRALDAASQHGVMAACEGINVVARHDAVLPAEGARSMAADRVRQNLVAASEIAAGALGVKSAGKGVEAVAAADKATSQESVEEGAEGAEGLAQSPSNENGVEAAPVGDNAEAKGKDEGKAKGKDEGKDEGKNEEKEKDTLTHELTEGDIQTLHGCRRFAAVTCQSIRNLCLNKSLGVPVASLRGACAPVARLLQLGNAGQGRHLHDLQKEACLAIMGLAREDAGNRLRLVEQGAVEAVLDALKQTAWEEKSFNLVAIVALQSLLEDQEGMRRLGARPKAATCQLLVDAVWGVLGTQDDSIYGKCMVQAVKFWPAVLTVHPAWRKHLLAAGAKHVLHLAATGAEIRGTPSPRIGSVPYGRPSRKSCGPEIKAARGSGPQLIGSGHRKANKQEVST
eukprot:jgi/Mesvir1/23146/Mv05841-RA.1